MRSPAVLKENFLPTEIKATRTLVPGLVCKTLRTVCTVGAKPAPHQKRAITILVALFIWPLIISHSCSATEDDTQQWTTITVEHAFSKRLTLSFKSRLRLDEDVSRAKDLTLGPAAELQILPRFHLGAGYDYIYSYASNSSREHRIYEQVRLEQDPDDLSIDNRLRIEQRFLEDADNVVWRARYRLRLEHPLRHPDWKVIGSDEVFVNLNSKAGGPGSGFGENRLFVGFGRAVIKQLWIEAGYQWGYEVERNKEDQITHSLLLNFTYHF